MAKTAKPNAGQAIRSVRLIPAPELSVTMDAGESGTARIDTTLQEGTPSACLSIERHGLSGEYSETIDTANGLPVVRHTLTLSVDPEPVRSWLTADWLERITVEGVAARIEMQAEENVFLVGWSEKFGTEHALRLTEARYESGKTPALPSVLTLVLTGEDTAPAIRCQ